MRCLCFCGLFLYQRSQVPHHLQTTLPPIRYTKTMKHERVIIPQHTHRRVQASGRWQLDTRHTGMTGSGDALRRGGEVELFAVFAGAHIAAASMQSGAGRRCCCCTITRGEEGYFLDSGLTAFRFRCLCDRDVCLGVRWRRFNAAPRHTLSRYLPTSLLEAAVSPKLFPRQPWAMISFSSDDGDAIVHGPKRGRAR